MTRITDSFATLPVAAAVDKDGDGQAAHSDSLLRFLASRFPGNVDT